MRPPFHVNPDAHHCVQCTLRMALEAIEPDRTTSLRVLDILTRRRPGEGTWTHSVYLALPKLRVEARAWDAFDYASFAKDPLNTVFRTFPGPVATRLAVGLDLASASALARELLQTNPIPIEPRSPTLADVDALLDEGWLLIANVNAAALDGDEGTEGHSVLIFDRDEDALVLHDPGHEGAGQPDRRVRREVFERAWSFMGETHRELLALRAPRDGD